MRLDKLCNIHSGYTARGSLDPLFEGGIPAIQLRDVGTDGEPLRPVLRRYDLANLSDRYFVHGGEVLFRSRGAFLLGTPTTPVAYFYAGALAYILSGVDSSAPPA